MEIKGLIENNPDQNPLKTAVEHMMKVKGWALSSEKRFMETSILLQDFWEEVEHLKNELQKQNS